MPKIELLEIDLTDEVLEDWDKSYELSNTNILAGRIIRTLINEIRKLRKG